METAALPHYDPEVIERFAENLYRKASAFVTGSIVVGGALGAAFGATPLTSLGAAWPVPSFLGFATLLAGALIGAVVGYVVGDARAFAYRLQAQTALCQLQVERNTAAAGRILAALAARRPAPAAAPRVAAPAPTPPPAAVAPVPAPPPAVTPAPPTPAPAPAEPPVQPPVSNGTAAPARPPVTVRA